MARPPTSPPLDVFTANAEDAERLLNLARVLLNSRERRMRAELRRSFGDVMGVARRRQHELDCVESDHIFLLIKPEGEAERSHFTETQLRPLLRQSVVATAAAVESYVAEKACCYISEALGGEETPRRLLDIPVTFEKLRWIEDNYQRRGWGQRRILKDHLENAASVDPGKIGTVFATVGKKSIWKPVDGRRRVDPGTSEQQLREIARRRNLIAHTGDRKGAGKAPLSVEEVERWLRHARSIVHALEATL